MKLSTGETVVCAALPTDELLKHTVPTPWQKGVDEKGPYLRSGSSSIIVARFGYVFGREEAHVELARRAINSFEASRAVLQASELEHGNLLKDAAALAEEHDQPDMARLLRMKADMEYVAGLLMERDDEPVVSGGKDEKEEAQQDQAAEKEAVE